MNGLNVQPAAESQNENYRGTVVLIYPPLEEYAYKIRVQDRESLAIGYLSTALSRNGFKVEAINAELEELTVDEVLDRARAIGTCTLIGLSIGAQRNYLVAKSLAAQLKKVFPETHITCGGIFPTSVHKQIIEETPEIDSVVRGEGEAAIVELATRMCENASLDGMLGITHRRNGQIIAESDRPRVSNLDDLGNPTRTDLERMFKMGKAPRAAKLIASRGCYARCSFCSIHMIYGNRLVARRSPAHVVAEMVSIAQEFGISRFAFMDDLFITPSGNGVKWVEQFCDELAKVEQRFRFWVETRADTVEPDIIRRLRENGLDSIFIGIEAGVDSMLKRLDKDVAQEENDRALKVLRDAGLRGEDIRIGYIMFEPEMNFEELKAQFHWLVRSGHARVQNLQNKINVYRDTPLYVRRMGGSAQPALKEGLLKYEFNDEKVRNFEHHFRRFHRQCVDEWMLPVVHARAIYIDFANQHETLPAWLKDLLSQVLRRIEGGERGLYYAFFRWALDLADRAVIEDRDLARFFDTIRDQISSVQTEATCLVRIIKLLGTKPPSKDAEAIQHGALSARVDGSSAMIVCGGQGFRAKLGGSGYDVYDHECSYLEFASA